MTVGALGMTIYHRHSEDTLSICHSEDLLSICHSEERTTKNLRGLLMRCIVVGMNQPSDGDLRFLASLGMTVGVVGMTGERSE